MTRGIFLIQSDNSLIEMREQPYASEDLLQGYLASYPNLMPGDQINPGQPRRWLLITREASLPSEEGGPGRWAVDNLFLDQDGVPTIVEVKRSSDTRIRREVVGQMLDYAANAVVYWSVEHLRAQHERQCHARGVDAERQMAEFLGAEADPEQFWQKAKTNLLAGRVRLVFVADSIPVELRRVVEFLNEQMDPAEILAVEIKQFVDEGSNLKILAPSVIGQTAEAQQRKAGGRGDKSRLDEGTFFEKLAGRRGADETQAARKILEWARPPRSTYVWWGKASFVPVLDTPRGVRYQLFAVYTDGTVQIYFQVYQTRPVFKEESKRLELLERLNAIEGVSISPDKITKYPAIRLSILENEDNLKRFFATYEWFIGQVT